MVLFLCYYIDLYVLYKHSNITYSQSLMVEDCPTSFSYCGYSQCNVTAW